jgi:glyoxylate/hydroxypyruvate reductase A
MGLGLIGLPCATLVRDIGFQTASWTRTPKSVTGIENFHGADGLEPFLARSEIVVNILPLTADTENIVDARTLAMLPAGASVINIGRGQHVVDDDLIAALDSGHLAGATLDVFRQEPLPGDHPFWTHPGITLMPHTARKSRPDQVAPQVADQVRRLRTGEPLTQLVDRGAGY